MLQTGCRWKAHRVWEVPEIKSIIIRTSPVPLPKPHREEMWSTQVRPPYLTFLPQSHWPEKSRLQTWCKHRPGDLWQQNRGAFKCYPSSTYRLTEARLRLLHCNDRKHAHLHVSATLRHRHLMENKNRVLSGFVNTDWLIVGRKAETICRQAADRRPCSHSCNPNMKPTFTPYSGLASVEGDAALYFLWTIEQETWE